MVAEALESLRCLLAEPPPPPSDDEWVFLRGHVCWMLAGPAPSSGAKLLRGDVRSPMMTGGMRRRLTGVPGGWIGGESSDAGAAAVSKGGESGRGIGSGECDLVGDSWFWNRSSSTNRFRRTAVDRVEMCS